MALRKVGILTGGGDAPGLNAVIRAVVIRLGMEERDQYQCIGIIDGWRGLVTAETEPLVPAKVNTILHEGGTILGTSRTNLYSKKTRDVEVPKAVETYNKLGLDALVAIGGDDTLEIAYYLYRDEGLHTIGVPKTIDNDVLGTDFTFGFWSAVEQAVRSMDDLRVTTMSHHRVMVVECMGRNAGWITAYAGLASESDFICVPEKPTHLDEIIRAVKRTRERGKLHSIVCVAEGASIGGLELKPRVEKDAAGNWRLNYEVRRDSFGNPVFRPGEMAESLAEALAKETGLEVRGIALGHLQRGGAPCAFDRILGTRFGVEAAKSVIHNRWGHMVCLRGLQVDSIPFQGNVRESQDERKRYQLLPTSFMDLAEIFYG